MLHDSKTDPSGSQAPISSVPLSVNVLSKWEELYSLEPEWNSILEGNPKLTIFSTPEWLGSWWRAYGNGKSKQLQVLTFRDTQGLLVGLLPLYLKRITLPMLPPLGELRFVGDGSTDSDNLDFIVLPGYERAVVRALVQHLATAQHWDLCQFNVIPFDSVTANIFLQEITEARWNCETSVVPWTAIELPDTWDKYLNQLSPKERKKIRNLTRRLEKRYQVRSCRCNSLSELPACLENLFRLHQKRWELRGEPGTFALTARRRFYQDMAQRFLSRGWLAFWVLELDGTVVALQFGFRYRDAVYALQEGFDPAYANDSVGYILRGYSLRELIESGVHRYEFLAGENDNKLRWRAMAGNYLNIHTARPGTRGSVHLHLVHLLKTSKSFIRRLLPAALVNYLNSLRHDSPQD